MSEFSVELIGWAGASAFVIAYLLLSIKVLSSEKVLYHGLNAAGGLMMSVSTYHLADRPAFFVNVIWMGIAVYAIFRIVLLKTGKH